jgi:hypothetical protein
MDFLGFEVLTAVDVKNSIFWDIIPYSPLIFKPHLRAAC